MSRQRLYRLAAWLLPLLIARLLVPDGFMLSANDRGLDMAMCSGYASLPQASVRPAGTEHVAYQPHGATRLAPDTAPDHQGHDKPRCPFALAGTGFVNLPLDVAGPLYYLVDDVPIDGVAPAWISPAVLIDRIRGPPSA